MAETATARFPSGASNTFPGRLREGVDLSSCVERLTMRCSVGKRARGGSGEMNEAVVAFSFGVPNTLRSNRLIAKIAAEKAKSRRVPVYTQLDVLPLDPGIDVELIKEEYPKRVPSLRIARGAIRWAQARGIDTIWICAAKPHLARTTRDLNCAIEEANASISIKICEAIDEHPSHLWFCEDSTQSDTRLPWLWKLRDAILLHMPRRLYSRIAS